MEEMLILSWRCFLLHQEAGITEGKRKALEECTLFKDIKMIHKLLDQNLLIFVSSHPWSGALQKGLCSKKEQSPLIHVALWFSLLGVYIFLPREQFDFLGLEPLLSEHKTSQKPKPKSVAYKIYGKLRKNSSSTPFNSFPLYSFFNVVFPYTPC